MQSHACNAGLLFYTACCSSAIFSSISSVCVLPSPSSMMCLASQLGRQHRFCTALCTMPGFFMLYLVSGLGCSTKACHCVLWLVASCCAVPCCAVLWCPNTNAVQLHGSFVVPSSILLSCAVLINPYCNSPVLKVARPLLKSGFSVGPHFISSSSFSLLLLLT